jgi:hypothetical protein
LCHAPNSTDLAQPSRLDLDEMALAAAKTAQGCPRTWHRRTRLMKSVFMEYGIYETRRAGLDAADIADARSVPRMQKHYI